MLKKIIAIVIITTLAFAQETRKKVAILDTGIDENFPSDYLCSEGNKDFTGFGLHDYVKHGSHIAYIIKDYIDPKKECILILKFYDHTNPLNNSPILEAYQYLRTLNVDFLNMSFGGENSSKFEKDVILSLLERNTIISVAAGNDHTNLSEKCDFFPACYYFQNKNYFVVASCKEDVIESYSNFGGPVTSCRNGTKVKAGPYIFTGTSQSSAIQTGINVREERNKTH